VDYYLLLYTHCEELIKSVGSHGSSSLQFKMKVMVWNSLSDIHKVMTTLIVVMVHKTCCCRIFLCNFADMRKCSSIFLLICKKLMLFQLSTELLFLKVLMSRLVCLNVKFQPVIAVSM
jgi:hypothetical protein